MKSSSSSVVCLKQVWCGNSERSKVNEKYMSCSEFHIHDTERITGEFYIVIIVTICPILYVLFSLISSFFKVNKCKMSCFLVMNIW
jgi:hypothetical protein